MRMKPICDRCRHSGFWMVRAPDDRPRFVCDKCRNTWTCGHDGKPYTGHEMNPKYDLPEWVKEHDCEPHEPVNKEQYEKFCRLLASIKYQPTRPKKPWKSKRKK